MLKLSLTKMIDILASGLRQKSLQVGSDMRISSITILNANNKVQPKT